MNEINKVTQLAFDLFRRSPHRAGFSMCLHNGQLVPEWLSLFDVWVYCDEKDGILEVRVERVIGLRKMMTMPDVTEVVSWFSSKYFDGASEMLRLVLRRLFVNDSYLKVRRLFYRNDHFSVWKRESEPHEQTPEIRMTWWTKWFGTFCNPVPAKTDSQLAESVEAIVESGMGWGEDKFIPETVSLWFYPDGMDWSAIYIKITPRALGYDVEIEDRVVVDWRSQTFRAETIDGLKSRIAAYFTKQHAFEFSGMRVYLAYCI